VVSIFIDGIEALIHKMKGAKKKWWDSSY
jgi:hypothetical protein